MHNKILIVIRRKKILSRIVNILDLKRKLLILKIRMS